MKLVVIAFLAVGVLAMTGLVTIANQRAAGDRDPGEIIMTEMRFSPNRTDGRVGEPMILIIVNRGSLRHDLAFPPQSMPGLQGVETLTMPGESTRLTLTFESAGVYLFECTIPGHAASGMTGAVFISP